MTCNCLFPLCSSKGHWASEAG